jgi:hypothetical protein
LNKDVAPEQNTKKARGERFKRGENQHFISKKDRDSSVGDILAKKVSNEYVEYLEKQP